jgi:FMN phosphatase YigB (HAD superfamily)
VLLEKLNVKPEELIYSDDNPARLSGAHELGIQTFVFQNFDQFMDELKKRGIDLK